MRLFRINPAIAAILVVALLGAVVYAVWPHAGTRTLVADFPRTVSLYKGSDVKILGVAVGKVTDVTPEGTKVVVQMQYDDKYKLPSDAKAAVISPSIVGDRFVQLTPVYQGGQTLADGAHLGMDRTATPLELDEIFGNLNDLNKALGPQGANSDGSLTRLLQSTARNFGGQGVQFNQTIKNLGRLTQTLADNKDQLFGTARDVEVFVQALSKNDTTVRRFNDSLASGSALLAGERQDLAAALHNLSVAMTQVRSFVADNKQALGSNISGLKQISGTLVKRRQAIDEILRVAPGALNNLALAYDGASGTLDTRANIGETANQLSADPKTVICTFLGTTPAGNNACKSLAGALGRTSPFGSPRVTAPTTTVVEPIDPTLGGLVEVRHR